jgi:hypothetical protein
VRINFAVREKLPGLLKESFEVMVCSDLLEPGFKAVPKFEGVLHEA